jgi:surfeit locus 1 family protein
MARRTLVAAVVALGAALLFARLGVWQLHRLAERRAFNAQLERRLREAPVSLADLPRDTSLAKYRRVRVTGTFDYEHQIILTGRSRRGAPGVYLITPLVPDAGGRAVLVNRGWVYSPDAATVNLADWHEPEHTTVEGYVQVIPAHVSFDPRSATNPMAWRELDRSRLAVALPYPVEPVAIVALGLGEQPPGAPTRLELPAMDEGPHKSYAIQWFTFAAIALYGVGYLIWYDRHGRPSRAVERSPVVRGL